MTENLKKILSGREKLKSLEAEDKFVFHGSENNDLEELEPRQAYTNDAEGNKVEDDEPAVHASPFADIAILMALVNMKNCPAGFESGFRFEDKPVLSATQHSLEQLNDNSKGFVYVFTKEDFIPRGRSQAISYKHVRPIQMFEVGKSDLPEEIEIQQESAPLP